MPSTLKSIHIFVNIVLWKEKFHFSTQTNVVFIISWVISVPTCEKLVYLWSKSTYFVGHFGTNNLKLSDNLLRRWVFVCCCFDTFKTSCRCLKCFWLCTVYDLRYQALNFTITYWLSITWCTYSIHMIHRFQCISVQVHIVEKLFTSRAQTLKYKSSTSKVDLVTLTSTST